MLCTLCSIEVNKVFLRLLLACNLPELSVLLMQDLGYGTVQKRYRGGANRNAHLSPDSASPTTGQVCSGYILYYFTHESVKNFKVA